MLAVLVEMEQELARLDHHGADPAAPVADTEPPGASRGRPT
jgi:hypothetical protein